MLTSEQHFNYQYQVSKDYVIDYTGVPQSVLEIGCGEGGNLLAYADENCDITGIDKSAEKIKYAESKLKATLICGKIQDNFLLERFDLIILKDVLEHIHAQPFFIDYLRYFLNPDGKIFIAFSPWSMPFGGHQQCCKSFLRYIPWLHLLPIYGTSLRLLETPTRANALLEIKQTRISIKRFKQMIKGYKIEKETFWLINPSYHAKLGIKPIKFINILFLVTSYWCIIKSR